MYGIVEGEYNSATSEWANYRYYIPALEVKQQQSFYTAYKCEKGHISTPTGTEADKYDNQLSYTQTTLTKCAYAGCNSTNLTKLSNKNLVFIKEEYIGSYFNNVYCVDHWQHLGSVIQYRSRSNF